MSEENSARAFRDEGSFLHRQGRLEEAEEAFFKALTFYGAAHDHETLFRVAELFLEKKGPAAALDYYLLAIRANRDSGLYKQRFLDVCGAVTASYYNSDAEEIFLACLQTAGLDFAGAGPLWLSLLLSNPDFARLYADRQVFEKKLDVAPLLQPYFIEGLKRVTVCDSGFEDFIRRLRQWLLLGLSVPSQRPPLADYLRLAEAVADYCSFGGYVIKTTPAENIGLRKISDQADKLAVAVRACYIPPEKCTPASDAIKETKITDSFSLRVKEHYEGSPGQRWRNLPAHTISSGHYFPRREKMERTFAGAWPELLVAGCGTGRETLMAALHYPKGKVTAIDLSRSSLAYAAQKAREYNITNIEFRQDDILNLAKEMKVYDIVYATDVLHHMRDLLAGWKILWDRVKPAGIMKVGLLTAHGGSSDTDMRRFTLPEIEETLKKLRLSFTGFDLPAGVLEIYGQKFPDDKNMVSLKNWHQFEEENPNTFAGMYQFWCRKF